MIKRGMILAAGLGTRFKPWTDKHPKALAIVNGKTLLQRNIEYLQRYGIRDVVVNVHHFAGQIVEAIDKNAGWGSLVTVSDETDEVLETGGGLKRAERWLKEEPFLLMNADILTDLDLSLMIGDHFAKRPLVTLAVTGRESSRCFLFDGDFRLCGWRNLTTGEEKIARQDIFIQKAFSGIQIVEPAIFPLITREGKFSLVDVYLDLAGAHRILGFDHSDSKLIDVGRTEAVARAERLFP